MDGTQYFQALAAVELHIQYNNIGLRGENAVDARLRRFSLTDYRRRRSAQHRGNPSADQDGVVGQENLQREIAAWHDPYFARAASPRTSASAESRARAMLKRGRAASEGA